MNDGYVYPSLTQIMDSFSCSPFTIVSMIRKCHNHKLQTNLWHHEEEPHNNHKTPGRQTKQSNLLSLPHRDDCKTRMTQSNAQQNIEQLQSSTIYGISLFKKSSHMLASQKFLNTLRFNMTWWCHFNTAMTSLAHEFHCKQCTALVWQPG